MKGKTPQVGDRVLVEAVYNPNMPFKWNAQRIQTLPQLANQSVRTLWLHSVAQKGEDNIVGHIYTIWGFCLNFYSHLEFCYYKCKQLKIFKNAVSASKRHILYLAFLLKKHLIHTYYVMFT